MAEHAAGSSRCGAARCQNHYDFRGIGVDGFEHTCRGGSAFARLTCCAPQVHHPHVLHIPELQLSEGQLLLKPGRLCQWQTDRGCYPRQRPDHQGQHGEAPEVVPPCPFVFVGVNSSILRRPLTVSFGLSFSPAVAAGWCASARLEVRGCVDRRQTTSASRVPDH